MTQPLWIRAVMVREGDDVVTKCCIVADGDFHPFEVRVNLPKLAASIRKLQGSGVLRQDVVGGFGSFLKKAVKSVTKNKITRAVTKVVRKVASNPIVQIANPMLAIAAHTSMKAATGKGTIKGKLGTVVDAGTAFVMPKALAYVRPQAIAALGIGARAVTQSQLGKTISTAAKSAQKTIAQGKTVAAAVKSGKLSFAAAAPLLKKAVAVQATVKKVAPKLAVSAAASKKVRAAISNIATKAKAGNPEAKLAAGAITAAAKMTDKISAAQQAAGGGHAGFVITKTGAIRKAPKKKFVRSAALPVIETLYRGSKTAPLTGSFSAVSGARKRKPAAHEFYSRQTLVPETYPELEQEIYRFLEDPYQRETLPAPSPYYVEGRPRSKSEEIAHNTKGALAAASVMRRPFGPILSQATNQLLALERRGEITRGQTFVAFTMIQRAAAKLGKGVVSGSPGSVEHTPAWGGARDPGDEYDGPIAPVRYNDPSVQGRPRPARAQSWPQPQPQTRAAARERAAALLELARARHHLEQARKRGTKVGNMNHISIGGGHELPDEMSQNSDGISDSAAYTAEIVGCGGDVGCEIAGLPAYLLNRKGLSSAVVRRRVAASIKAMPPKMRRRVLDRLRMAVRAARPLVSGNLHHAYASVQGGWSGIVSGADGGGYEIVGSHRAHSLTP